jgi:hypothetical protein
MMPRRLPRRKCPVHIRALIVAFTTITVRKDESRMFDSGK